MIAGLQQRWPSSSFGEKVGVFNVIGSVPCMAKVSADPSEGDIPVRRLAYSPSLCEVLFMGIAVVAGGQVSIWNAALQAGFWQALLGIGIIALGYACLVCCVGEMITMFPFKAHFSAVRCALGPLAGYLVGACEATAYMTWLAATLILFGDAFGRMVHCSLHPLLWLLLCALVLPCQALGDRALWFPAIALSCMSIAVVMLFCFSNTPRFMQFEDNHRIAGHGPLSFLHCLPAVASMLRGAEVVVISCKDKHNQSPYVMLSVLAAAVVSGTAIVWMASSIAPGPDHLQYAELPLTYGLQHGLGISDRAAAALMLPALAASAHALTHAAAQQMHALACCGLLPRPLQWTTDQHGAPVAALLSASLLSYLMALVGHGISTDATALLFGIGLLASCAVNLCLFRAFMVYNYRYPALDRRFTNPFGLCAAWLGMALFIVLAAATAFSDLSVLIAMSAVLLVAWLLHAFVFEDTQCFSEDELYTFYHIYIWHIERTLALQAGRQNSLLKRISKSLKSNAVKTTSSISLLTRKNVWASLALDRYFEHGRDLEVVPPAGPRNPTLRAMVTEDGEYTRRKRAHPV